MTRILNFTREHLPVALTALCGIPKLQKYAMLFYFKGPDYGAKIRVLKLNNIERTVISFLALELAVHRNNVKRANELSGFLLCGLVLLDETDAVRILVESMTNPDKGGNMTSAVSACIHLRYLRNKEDYPEARRKFTRVEMLHARKNTWQYLEYLQATDLAYKSKSIMSGESISKLIADNFSEGLWIPIAILALYGAITLGQWLGKVF